MAAAWAPKPADLKMFVAKKKHGGLAGDLLEEDEATADHEGPGILQGLPARGRRGSRRLELLPDGRQLLLDLLPSDAAAESLQRRRGLAPQCARFVGDGARHLLEHQEARRLRHEGDADLHDRGDERGGPDHEAPPLELEVMEGNTSGESQEHPKHDHHLFTRYQGPAHLGSGDLRNVHRRSMHCKADAEAVDGEPCIDPPQHRRERSDSCADQIQHATDLHLQLAA
mmetsp:Transcript_81075/g.262556  ORF Transcript_81075/g.262556 Transcript_81075/m.262556 type:complete len:227 (+) Transcript_81075:585-1265(+)